MELEAYKKRYPVVPKKVYEFQGVIGYEFKIIEYLYNALIHSSYAAEHYRDVTRSNERLEFLGDAVLENVSSEYLFINNPDKGEGSLSSIRASLVCEDALFKRSFSFSLPEYLFLGVGEEKSGGRSKPSIVSDAVEAVIGAIFIDGGYDAAKAFISRYILTDIDEDRINDPKTYLQVLAQEHLKITPVYELVSSDTTDGVAYVTMRCRIGDVYECIRRDQSKKKACESAALVLIKEIKAGLDKD